MADPNMFDEFVTAPTPQQGQQPPTLAVRPVEPPRSNIFDEFTSPSFPGPTGTPGATPNKVFGELKPSPDKTPTEQLKSDLQDTFIKWGANPYNAGRLGRGAVDIAGFNPVMGGVLAGADLAHDLPRGNVASSVFDTLGLIPGGIAARRAIRGAPEVIPALNPPQWAYQQGNPTWASLGLRGGGPRPPASVTGTPPEMMGYVTPSSAELAGRGARYGEPVGTAQQGYDAINQSPIRYHPNAGYDFAALAAQHIEQAQPGLGFSRFKAPIVYDTLDNFAREAAQRGQLLTPANLDTLRQSLRGLPDANGPAGNRVAELLDAYMSTGASGRMVQGTPQDLAEMRATMHQARGDYQKGVTSRVVEDAIDRAGTRAGSTYSGGNLENATHQNMAAFSNSDAGREKIFGATLPEREAIWRASQPEGVGDWQRWGGKLLGGGGGMHQWNVGGSSAAAGTLAGHFLGLDPYTSMAIGAGVGGATMGLGSALTRAGSQRAVNIAEEAAAQIRRNSPEYARRAALPENTPVADPRTSARDAIAMALMPTIREGGPDVWGQQYVPYENR